MVEWELFNVNKGCPAVHSFTEAHSVLLLYTHTQSLIMPVLLNTTELHNASTTVHTHRKTKCIIIIVHSHIKPYNASSTQHTQNFIMPVLLHTCSQKTVMYTTVHSQSLIMPILPYTHIQKIILPVLLLTMYSGNTHVTKFPLSDCPLWCLNMICLSVQHEVVVVLLYEFICCSVLNVVGEYTLQWWQLCTLYFIMHFMPDTEPHPTA
jgi:hypothetical protein